MRGQGCFSVRLSVRWRRHCLVLQLIVYESESQWRHLSGQYGNKAKDEAFCPRKCFTHDVIFELHFARALATQRTTDSRLRVSSGNAIISGQQQAWLCGPSKTSPYTALCTNWVGPDPAWGVKKRRQPASQHQCARSQSQLHEQLGPSQSVRVPICKAGMIISFRWKFKFESISKL